MARFISFIYGKGGKKIHRLTNEATAQGWDCGATVTMHSEQWRNVDRDIVTITLHNGSNKNLAPTEEASFVLKKIKDKTVWAKYKP